MSALKARIQEDMKSAMRAGDKDRLGVIRMLLAAIKQREVDERTETTDVLVLQILEKQIKQRRESAAQFTAGDRPELAARELSEVTVLQEYLPQALTAAQLDTLIDEVMGATGASTMKDMGKVMAALRERAQGRADFGLIGERLKSRLSAK